MSNAVDAEGRSRQEQILLMAAEGLTDKEIASRLGLSPETVGTYWRRILAKYSACSRTEVVAKVIRLQAEASLGHLNELNASFIEVTDHLLLALSGKQENVDAGPYLSLLNALPEVILSLDSEGFVTYTNADRLGISINVGDPLEWAVDKYDQDEFREALGTAFDGQGITQVTFSMHGRTANARMQLTDDGNLAMTLRID